MKNMSDLQVMKIEELLPDPANVRRHPERNQQAALASMLRFKAARSVVIDKNGIVRAGNATLAAAKAAGITCVRIIETDGSELVAVRRSDWNDSVATAYSVADNRVAEHAEWSSELGDVIAALAHDGIELGDLGFTEEELTELFEGFGDQLGDSSQGTEPDPGPQMDRAAELLEKWKVESGQLWEVPSKSVAGKCHRVLCGDCTKAEHVERLFKTGEKAVLMNTDPPYGVAYTDEARVAAERAHGRPQRESKWEFGIKNDGIDGAKLQEFLEAAIRTAVRFLTDNAAFYLWHPMLTQGTFFAAAAAAADILIHRQIIWVKPSLLFGFGDYHWQHELCFYGWVKGNRPPFYGERNQTTIWDLRHETASIDRKHPTQKPVELFVRPIENHSKRGEIVYEPFAGSGSQFVAAEQTGRICCGIEIEPKYVSVILERLAGIGLTPRLV